MNLLTDIIFSEASYKENVHIKWDELPDDKPLIIPEDYSDTLWEKEWDETYQHNSEELGTENFPTGGTVVGKFTIHEISVDGTGIYAELEWEDA